MCESSVTFSISTDLNGNIKIICDGASKKKMATNDDDLSQKLSPCSSLRSLDITHDSEILKAGTRRRVHSTSIDSISDSMFDGEEARSSTPVFEDRSDTSFSSCVSNLSDTSIVTDSSQETVKSNSNSQHTERQQQQQPRWRMNSVSYEMKNKERYGGWVEGDWRSAMGPKKSTPPNQLKTPNTSFSSSSVKYVDHFHSGSATKSRIPSLKDRPSYKSPNTNTRPYSSVVNTPSPVVTAPNRVTTVPSTLKLTIISDPDGKMKIKFVNQTSEESWAVDGMQGLYEEIDVHKII